MKRIYDNPKVEITLFKTEEILINSGVGAYDLDEETGLTAEEVFGS